MASLEVGFSHDIFVEMASEARNLVLFTEKGQVCSCNAAYKSLILCRCVLAINIDMLSVASNPKWFVSCHK